METGSLARQAGAVQRARSAPWSSSSTVQSSPILREETVSCSPGCPSPSRGDRARRGRSRDALIERARSGGDTPRGMLHRGNRRRAGRDPPARADPLRGWFRSRRARHAGHIQDGSLTIGRMHDLTISLPAVRPTVTGRQLPNRQSSNRQIVNSSNEVGCQCLKATPSFARRGHFTARWPVASSRCSSPSIRRSRAIDHDAPIAGRTVASVSSRGKHLLMAFSGDLVLHTHMRMNGSWHVYRTGERWRAPAHDMRVCVATSEVRRRRIQHPRGGVPVRTTACPSPADPVARA